MKGGSEAMQNPINAHLLVRHLALGWPAVDRALRSLLTTMETISMPAHESNASMHSYLIPSLYCQNTCKEGNKER